MKFNIKLQKEFNKQKYKKFKIKHNIKINEPSTFLFQKNNKKLYYIASKHTNDNKSNTYKLIRKTIKMYNKRENNVIVLEGGAGKSPKINYGEGKFAIDYAKKFKIDYFGIEKPINKLLKYVMKDFILDDIYGYIFLMMSRQSFDMGLTEKKMWNDYKIYSKWYYKNLKKLKFDPKIWFRNTYNKKYIYGKYLDYSSPSGDKITNKIAIRIGKIRNYYLLKNMLKLFNNYDTIFYVIGEGHLYSDFPVLLDYFGKSEIIKI